MVQLTLFLTALLGSTAFAGTTFRPAAGDSWNIQLATTPSITQANNPAYRIWDMDMEDTPASTIKAFKDKGKKVICYISAGSWEDWRDDKNKFPAAAIGKAMDGWPGEKWIDTRNQGVRNVVKARIALAARKGCDGIDADNVDGYTNDTGFDLTEADGADYVRFLARTAHDAGISYGLKNGGSIIKQVVGVSDWVVNEQCVQYSECHLYQPFIQQGKPVLHIEYTEQNQTLKEKINRVCNAAGAKGFSSLIKHMDLSEWVETCPQAQRRLAKRDYEARRKIQ